MVRVTTGGAWGAIGWLAFPAVPVALARVYHQGVGRYVPDLADWGSWEWAVLLGPLWGFGFLAGATLGLPDDPGRGGIRSWPSKRAAWVAVGPWAGFVLLSTLPPLLGATGASRPWDAALERIGPGPASWVRTTVFWALAAVFTNGWLIVAWFALRRARRRGQLGRTIGRGLVTAVGFVGSLVGGFWAVTATWRAYFFDPTPFRVVLLAALGAGALGGCGDETVGDVRRRELFGAMQMAWAFGLALAWLWWGRPRSRPGPPGRRASDRREPQ